MGGGSSGGGSSSSSDGGGGSSSSSSSSNRAIMNILMSWYSPNRPEAIHVWWERKYSRNIIERHHVG